MDEDRFEVGLTGCLSCGAWVAGAGTVIHREGCPSLAPRPEPHFQVVKLDEKTGTITIDVPAARAVRGR